MFRRNKLTLLQSKDGRIKVINERIVLTERHLLSLCNSFAATTRKIARNRDIYDELAKGFRSYTDEEEINESLTEGLKNFSNALTILGDYMDHNVHRMEAKVVNELAQIEQLCKTTRDNLRAAVIARDKEVIKQKQLIDIKSKFNANNTAADSELVKAKLEVNRANKKIDEIINNFEKRKLSLVKEVLSNFIQISLKYHTKSIEALTASFYDISNIDEQGDLQEFKKAMKSKEDLQQKTFLSKKALLLKSKSMEHLDNNSDTAMSPLKRSSRLSRSQKSLAQESDDYGEEEDGEEEDDDEEEEEFDENSEEDSGSASEDEDDDDDSGSHGIPGKTKRRIEDTKEKWNKPPLQPFKAVNVAKPSSRLRKPFAATGAEGIPSKSGTFTKPSSSNRPITVVEPKGSSSKQRPHRGGDSEGDARLD